MSSFRSKIDTLTARKQVNRTANHAICTTLLFVWDWTRREGPIWSSSSCISLMLDTFVVCLYNVVCDVQWRLCCTWHKSSTCQVINFFDNRQSDERKRNDNDVYICNIYIYLVYLVNNVSFLYLSIYILYSDWQRDPCIK